MKSDAQLRSDVVAELTWEPAITATDVGDLDLPGFAIGLSRQRWTSRVRW